MRRLVDLNRGAVFKDTIGLVFSAPFKLVDQVRQGPTDPEMNARSIYHHTGGYWAIPPYAHGSANTRPGEGQVEDQLQHCPWQ